MWLVSQYSIIKAYILCLPGWRSTKLYQVKATGDQILEKAQILDLAVSLMQIHFFHISCDLGQINLPFNMSKKEKTMTNL